MSEQAPNEKQFGLKPSEARMLMALEQQFMQSLGLFLSFIAIERLAYNVTEKTQFRTEGDKLFIHEQEPQQPEAPSVATADGDTGDALKGKKK